MAVDLTELDEDALSGLLHVLDERKTAIRKRQRAIGHQIAVCRARQAAKAAAKAAQDAAEAAQVIALVGIEPTDPAA